MEAHGFCLPLLDGGLYGNKRHVAHDVCLDVFRIVVFQFGLLLALVFAAAYGSVRVGLQEPFAVVNGMRF